ncbi:MAG: hypothetical protein ACRDSJ_01375, partial [Rubrobacteraceae bacterium]
FALARYNAGGARDTTFSGDGVQTTDFGSFDQAKAVAVGPDSRITVAGSTQNGFLNEDFAVARYIGDATPPDTTITSGPPAKTKKTTASFSFTSEPGARFQCSLDGAAFTDCASPKTFTGLSRKKHTFRVRAIDRAGNVDPTPAVRSWTVKAVRRRRRSRAPSQIGSRWSRSKGRGGHGDYRWRREAGRKGAGDVGRGSSRA